MDAAGSEPATWLPVRGSPRDARPNACSLGFAATRLDVDVWLDIPLRVICSSAPRSTGRSARAAPMRLICHRMVARLDFGTRASVLRRMPVVLGIQGQCLAALRRSFQRNLSTRRFESSWVHTPRHHGRMAVRGRFLECLIHVPDRGLSRCRSTILRRCSAKSAASRHITAPCRLWAFGVAFGPSKTETYAAA